MKKAGLAVALMLAGGRAWAGTPYVLQNSLNRAPAVVLHCSTGGNVVVPCGTAAMPRV